MEGVAPPAPEEAELETEDEALAVVEADVDVAEVALAVTPEDDETEVALAVVEADVDVDVAEVALAFVAEDDETEVPPVPPELAVFPEHESANGMARATWAHFSIGPLYALTLLRTPRFAANASATNRHTPDCLKTLQNDFF